MIIIIVLLSESDTKSLKVHTYITYYIERCILLNYTTTLVYVLYKIIMWNKKNTLKK